MRGGITACVAFQVAVHIDRGVTAHVAFQVAVHNDRECYCPCGISSGCAQ